MQELPVVYGVKTDRLDLARNDHAKTKRRANHGRVFNSLTFRTNTASDLSVWFRVKEKISAERAVYEMCDGGGSLCAPRLRTWRGVIKSARHLNGTELLKFMNRKVNALAPYREDKGRFGRKDYWASPLEFLDAGGDCEDFAILKYVSLIELGIPEENLHLVVVDDEKRKRAHALLTVQMAGKTYVLDSLEDRLLNRKKASRFNPRYSISGENRWIHVRYRRIAAR
ncbi:MAG: transglutaminase-like cysteine peptidase [Hyphomicrobiales bacterium]